MRSKTSYFNPTLFQKNLTRFWPLWGGTSLIGALFPLYFLTIILRKGGIGAMEDPLGVTYGYYSVVAYAVPIISLVYAVLCALAVWGWLYNAKSVGMYHSLPVTRRGLFLTDFLSGMAMMLIPYAVTGALSIAVTALVRAVDPAGLLATILCVAGESLFFFASATLIVFITGNPFAFAAFYFLFHFFAAGAEWLICQLTTLFYFGAEQYYEGVAEFLSPVIFLMRNLSVDTTSEQITMPDGWIEDGKIQSVTLDNGWLIAVYALAGIVLLGCAWALYRRRRSESAGDVVAVGWMKPVFRYGFALCAAVAGGMGLYMLFFYDNIETANPVPTAFCMAAAGVLGYYIASMLLSKSLRVFRGSGKGVLITAIAAVALCFAVAADPFGVESWVPDPAKIEKAGFDLGGGGYMYVDFTDQAAIEKLLDLHRTVLSEKALLNDRDGELWSSDFHYSTRLEVRYWVNGKRTSRTYHIPISSNAAAQLESIQKAEILATDPAVQEADIFGGLTYSYNEEEIAGTQLIYGRVRSVYNTATGQTESLDLTAEQAEIVEAAIRRDIQAGHMGKTILLTNDEEREGLVYYNDIELFYSVAFKPGKRYPKGGTDTRSVALSLSVYCTETVKALEDIGILDSTHKQLTEAEYYAIERQENAGYYVDAEVYPEDAMVYADHPVSYTEAVY